MHGFEITQTAKNVIGCMFHQDSLDGYDDVRDIIRDGVREDTKLGLEMSKDVLDRLAAGNYSIDELEDIFDRAGCDVWFGNPNIREVLAFWRAEVDKRLSSLSAKT